VGKSVFSKLLSNKLDALLIGFDSISHMSLKDEKIKEKIKEYFGTDILTNSEIDRKKLGKIVFNDEKKLQYLNDLSQIFMENYIDDLIDKTDKKYIILDYALITKMKYFNYAKYKILITADKESRFDRLKRRDSVDDNYLEMREKNLPSYDKFDFNEIIDNSCKNELFLGDLVYEIAEKIKNTNINI
jgi:dephospho-CoA kinase